MENKTDFLIKELKQLVSSAMFNAKIAHEIICSENENELAIIGYINRSSSLFNSAKAIYLCNYELLEHSDIDEFFNQFDAFITEVLKNIKTSHSHQWSDVEFLSLQEKFDRCVLSQ